MGVGGVGGRGLCLSHVCVCAVCVCAVGAKEDSFFRQVVEVEHCVEIMYEMESRCGQSMSGVWKRGRGCLLVLLIVTTRYIH